MATATGAATRRQKVERKERAILEAARALFVELGYDGTRMAAIAARAGIGEGTVYSYYAAKSELMQAVLGEFWEDLTAGARAIVADRGDVFEQLGLLARYHLNAMIEQHDFLVLTHAVGNAHDDLAPSREQLRRYVAVFDEIYRRGCDRGQLRDADALWMMRDSFYGALEYSARTIILHQRDSGHTPDAVVANLIGQFRAWTRADAARAAVVSDEGALALRLERAVDRIEALMQS